MGYIKVVFILLALLVCSCERGEVSKEKAKTEETRPGEKEEISYWTCGMHPSVRVSPEGYKKGSTKCPICNMDLVPVKKGATEQEEESLTLSPAAEKLASVRTFEVTYLPLTKEIRTVGKIDYNERRLANVAARVSGRIDKLFVDFTGTDVNKGEPLVWIYSPALVSTQEEYLLAKETLEKVKDSHIPEVIDNAKSLVESTKRRFLLWGITDEQIKELEENKEAQTHMTIYAPISGTVIQKTALEGKYVMEGEDIYCITDLSNLWMLADVYEEELSWVKIGQEVEITSVAYPGEVFKGKVSFINPYLDEMTRSVKIRVDVPNPYKKLKPGMYMDAVIKATVAGKGSRYYTCPMHPEVVANSSGECPKCGMYLEEVASNLTLAVPKSAVLDVGMRKLVYVAKGKGKYEAREVKIGPEANSIIEGSKQSFFPVLNGLTKGEEVVTRANFLLDSETQLKGETAGAYGGALETE